MSDDEKQAWLDLWSAVFGEPPPIAPDGELAARILVQHLPLASPYQVRSRTE